MSKINTQVEPQSLRIHASKLFVDIPNYQRHSKERIFRKMGAFDWRMYAPIKVAKRANGMYAILDGQHRWLCGMDAGIEWFPCSVTVVDGIVDEALIFHGTNTKRGNTNAYETLRALATAKDKDAVEIARILARHGFQLAPTNDKDKIGASASLTKAYYDYGSENLDLALKTLRDAWGGEKDTLIHSFILGLSQFYYCASSSARKVEYEEFIKQLGKKTSMQVQRMFPGEYVKGVPHKAALAFADIYNKSRRKSRLPIGIFGRSRALDNKAKPTVV